MNLKKFLERNFYKTKFPANKNGWLFMTIMSLEQCFSKKDEKVSSLEFNLLVKISAEDVLVAIKGFYCYNGYSLADSRNMDLPDAFVLTFFKGKKRTTVKVSYLKEGFKVTMINYKT